MITNDYVPAQDDALKTWCTTLSNNAPTDGATAGMSPADISDTQGACKEIINAIDNNDAAHKAAKQAQKDKDTTLATNVPIIRGVAQRTKTNADYTSALGAKLGYEASHSSIDTNTYQPTIDAVAFPGHITLKFTKKGVEGVNIYERLKGELSWAKLSFDSHSPYVDNRPLSVANTAETREYMAIGVLHDSEVGQMSEIVNIVFGG